MHFPHPLGAGAALAVLGWFLTSAAGAPAATQSPPQEPQPPAAAGHYVLVVEGDRNALAITAAGKLDVGFDPINDLAPVALIGDIENWLLVNPNSQFKSVRDLIEFGKKNPGKLNYASSGIGSSAHLANELFNSMTKVSIVHIPYKGISEGIVATAGGQADMIFASITAALPLLETRRVRALAVTTGKRTPLAPAMPTLHESGVPGYDRSGWYGVLAPHGTPAPIITRLNTEINKALASPDLKEKLLSVGVQPLGTTPEQFATFIRSEATRYAKIIKAAGIKPE